MLDGHAANSAAASKLKKIAATTNVWESMGVDEKLSSNAVEMRKATAKMMTENLAEINKHVDATTFPFFMLEQCKNIGICGLTIKGYGSASLSNLDAAGIAYELAKRDGSFGLFFLAHTNLGMAVINALADEEQKQRWLPPAI